MITTKFKCVCGALLISSTLISVNLHAAAKNDLSIEKFVKTVHVEGIAFEEATKFDSSHVPVLLEMLNDPQEKAHRTNILVMLSMIGGAEIADTIIDVIEANTAPSEEAYLEKTNAIMSLGFIANRTGSQRAIDYLVKSAYPSTWSKTTLAKSAGDFIAGSSDAGAEDISKYAIFGLVLAGKNGESALNRMTQKIRANTDEKDASSAISASFMEEVLAENAKVSTLGLNNYRKRSDSDH